MHKLETDGIEYIPLSNFVTNGELKKDIVNALLDQDHGGKSFINLYERKESFHDFINNALKDDNALKDGGSGGGKGGYKKRRKSSKRKSSKRKSSKRKPTKKTRRKTRRHRRR